MDQLKYHIVYNLSAIDFSTVVNSTFNFSTKNPGQPTVELDRVKYMTLDSKKLSIAAELTVSFINKTDGKAFSLDSNDFSVEWTNPEIAYQCKGQNR